MCRGVSVLGSGQMTPMLVRIVTSRTRLGPWYYTMLRRTAAWVGQRTRRGGVYKYVYDRSLYSLLSPAISALSLIASCGDKTPSEAPVTQTRWVSH